MQGEFALHAARQADDRQRGLVGAAVGIWGLAALIAPAGRAGTIVLESIIGGFEFACELLGRKPGC